DRLGNQRLHLFRRSAGQICAHADRRQINRRKPIDAQFEITRRTDHDQRQNNHRGEDGTANTNFSELLHEGLFLVLCTLCFVLCSLNTQTSFYRTKLSADVKGQSTKYEAQLLKI